MEVLETVECGRLLASVFRARLVDNDHNKAAFAAAQAALGGKSGPPEPPGMVLAGIFHKHEIKNRWQAVWPWQFLTAVTDLVLRLKIRIMAGLIDAESRTVSDWLRISGANGTTVIALPMLLPEENRFVTHPHYMVVFGPACLKVCMPRYQSLLPDWLRPARGERSEPI